MISINGISTICLSTSKLQGELSNFSQIPVKSMLLKQSPGLGNKQAEFYSLILSQISIYMPSIMLAQEGLEMNKIIFIMKEDLGGSIAILGHRYYSRNSGSEAAQRRE